MKRIQPLQDYEQIRLLADRRRMRILRLLMAEPATLTQLARRLGQSPAWVRHHVLALQAAGLVELGEVRTTGKVTEKYYRARAAAFFLQEILLPEGKKQVMLVSGSHDLALEGVCAQVAGRLDVLNLPVGSLDGLINLRQGLCQVCGSHLLDASGEYNLPFIRHLFPDREAEVVTLAHRTQGWMLAPGNPTGMNGINDLPRMRFVNRNRGSGTRLWIDTELHRAGIPAEHVNGYQREVSTHTEAADLIAAGKADVSLGLQAAAAQHGLDFIPLFEERYDLVLMREQERALTPILDYIQTREFRRALTALPGYNPAHSGQQIHL